MDPRFKKRALVKVGYSCNNNCVFCHSSPHRGFDLSPTQLIKRFEMAASRGADCIVLSGGEPTIRPDLLAASRWLKSHGLGLGLVTNGRMLVYDRLRRELLENGLEYVYLSLSGTDEASFNWHTRAKSFEQFVSVAPLLAKEVEDFTINFVITAKNLPTLEDICPFLEGLGLDDIRLKFSLLEPEGNALDNYGELVPPLRDAGEKLQEVIGLISKTLPSLQLSVDGFPLCVPGGTDNLEAGLREDGFFIMAEAFEEIFFPVDDRNRSHGQGCVACSLAKKCKGVFKTYLEISGDHELKPVHSPVPNSFDLVEISPNLPFDENNCQVLTNSYPPADPVRGLFIAGDSGTIRQYHTYCTDFSDLTIQTCLHERNQVYLFDTPSPAPTDFETQLRRMEKTHTCIHCPRSSECGGIFRLSEKNGFKIVTDFLKKSLGELRGRILDIGCGNSPYLEFMEPTIQAGKLQYIGLDSSVSEKHSGDNKQFILSSFESFEPPADPFDAILSLRSFNHLNDPIESLARIKDMLRPGGRIILAEDVVFSLVRPRENLEKTHSSEDLHFEHKFNLDSEDVCSIAEQLDLKIAERLSCIQTRTPLWIVILEKK